MRSDNRYAVYVSLGRGDDGKRIRKVFYGATQREAKAKRDEFLRMRSEGLEGAQDSLHSWIMEWVKTSSNSPYMRSSNALQAKKLDNALGQKQIGDIRMIDIQIFAQSVSHMSFSSVKSIKRVTNKIFRDAVLNRVIRYNPTEGVQWDYASKGTHRALEPWEKALIIDHWEVHRAGLWAMLMLFAGLRRGEAIALQWEDIDFDAKVIHVTKAVHFESNKVVPGTTKTDAGVRDIPLLPQLEYALRRARRPFGAVCLGANGDAVQTQAAFRRGWEGLLNALENILNGELPFKPGRRSDLDKNRKKFSVRPHDLRHTFCTMLYNAGVGLKEAQYIMGHADATMTMKVYTHLDDAMRQSAAQKLLTYVENPHGSQAGSQNS